MIFSFRAHYRNLFLVDAVVHVLARSDAHWHCHTGGHRPAERVSDVDNYII